MSGAGGGAPALERDPDLDCPLPACTGKDCAEQVLVDGQRVFWHGFHRGLLYFVTDDPGPLGPGLYRLDVCGGEPELLYEAEHVAGIPAFTEDWIYLPVLSPGRIVRLRYDGTGVDVLREYTESGPDKPRAITYAPDAKFFQTDDFDWGIYISEYSFDGGLFLRAGTGRLDRVDPVVGALADASWPGTAEFPALPIVPIEVGLLGARDDSSFLVPHANGIERVVGSFYQEKYSDQPVLSALVKDDNFVYFADLAFVYRLPLLGYPDIEPGERVEAEPILDIYNGTRGIAVDDGWVYVSENYTEPDLGFLYRVRLSDGTPEAVLDVTDDHVQDFVLESESLYVRTDRSLVRVRKACPTPAETGCFRVD